MKHLFIALFFAAATVSVGAQSQSSPHETAYSFLRSGDYENAILVLNKALENDATNQQLLQDLAMSYFMKKDFSKAKDVVTGLLDRDDADVVTYQIAGNVYRKLEEIKDAEKMYKKALKKFPNSGPLYNEFGELLQAKQDFPAAIKSWEKGIEMDPSYPGNYFNAASYYSNTNNKIWTIIYGEIFANMEHLTERGTAMKKILLNAYKEKLFNKTDEGKDKSDFAKAVQETFDKQRPLIGKGLTPQTLTMIRTKFILDWFAKYGNKYPYKLFDYHQQMIKQGLFEAYNQWLFGSVDDLTAFDQWARTNSATYTKFDEFQKGRVFKMPQGQYYQLVQK